MASKPLPQNIEAEQSILGGILVDGNVINQVLEILTPEDFYREAHRVIFNAMIDLDRNSQPIDIVTLYESLRSKGKVLEEVGGSNYLTYLPEVLPSTLNVAHYAKLVKEKSILRRLIETANSIAHEGLGDSVDIEDYVERAEQAILDVGQNKVKPSFYGTGQLAGETLQLIESLQEKKEEVTGIPSGFERLDKMTAGFHPGDLTLVAARPGLGKTAFCLDIASYAAMKKDFSVAVFSLEMTKEQLMLRLFSSHSKVSYSRIRSGYIRDDEISKLVKAADKLSRAKVFIDDTPAITILELRAKARRQKREKGLDLIIIDYLQLMRGSSRAESREREIADISSSLKALAKELSIPVIALSQLSRQTEVRTDRRPQLSDLRESGTLEQDADLVLFIHRQDAYRTKPEDKAQRDGIAEIIIGKQRNGPTGSIKLMFLDQLGVPSFENLADDFEDSTI